MTSEVVIMNKRAVALAADSAITITGFSATKTRTTAEKIFSFSNKKSIGFMIYGSADLNDVPWELIINKFCKENKDKNFDKVKNISDKFIDFIKNDNELLGLDCQDFNTKIMIRDFCINVANMINEDIVDFSINKKTLSKSDYNNIKRNIINSNYEKFKQGKYVNGINRKFENNFHNKFKTCIDDNVNRYLKGFNLTNNLIARIKKSAVFLFTRNIVDPSMESGIVIVGFGDKEQYPCNVSFKTFCKFENILRYIPSTPKYITNSRASHLSAFAQHDMVKTFVQAINPDFMKTVNNTIKLLCKNYNDIVLDISDGKIKKSKEQQFKNELKNIKTDMIKNTIKELEKHQKYKFRLPTMSSISLLTKKELGELAEALIYLTAIKRKTSPELETVGGPIDVAVISKDEGFIWLNKKSYFDTELNPNWIKI